MVTRYCSPIAARLRVGILHHPAAGLRSVEVSSNADAL